MNQQLVCRRCLAKMPTTYELILHAACHPVSELPAGLDFDAIPDELQARALERVSEHVEEGYDPALVRFYRVPTGLYRCIAFEQRAERFRAGTDRPIGSEGER